MTDTKQTVLTDEECLQLRVGIGASDVAFARAVESAVISKLHAAPQASVDYQSVVDEALVVRHLGVSSGDARADLKRILDWDVAVALDPAVSSDAQALIDKGRNEEAEHFQRKLKDPDVVYINMLRGTIAPITFDQLAHILGDEATAKRIDTQATAKGGDVVAWTNYAGDIEPISDAVKQARPDLYAKHYTRPLAFADRQQRKGEGGE